MTTLSNDCEGMLWYDVHYMICLFHSNLLSQHLHKHFWQFSVSESFSKRLQHYFQMNLKSFLVRCTHYGLLSFCYSTVKINVTSTSTNTGTCTCTSKRRRRLILFIWCCQSAVIFQHFCTVISLLTPGGSVCSH